jgi:predicted Rossmann fold flavoprotein
MRRSLSHKNSREIAQDFSQDSLRKREAEFRRETSGKASRFSIAVIGAGMAGLCSAVTAAGILKERGIGCRSVAVLDAGTEPGRKLLVTGNGRCNVTNLLQSPECYRTEEPGERDRFGLGRKELSEEVIAFLRDELHVLCHDRNGYVYPRTDQAATIQQALAARCRELGIVLVCSTRVTDLSRECADSKSIYRLETDGGKMFRADAVILASGGMISEPYGCRGDGYRFAEAFGHRCIPPAPALCELKVHSDGLKRAAGVRTHGKVTLFVGGQEQASSEGELQLNKDSVSGIPVFQVSRYAGRAFGREVTAVLDFLPEVNSSDWKREISRRLQELNLKEAGQKTLQELCLGLIPDKAASWLITDLGGVPEQKLKGLQERIGEEGCRLFMTQLFGSMREKRLPVTGTAGYEKAQVSSGGIRLSEMTDHLESRCALGLFCAGEVLDVDGMCGGYNLTFALHSGRIAGRAAAQRCSRESSPTGSASDQTGGLSICWN